MRPVVLISCAAAAAAAACGSSGSRAPAKAPIANVPGPAPTFDSSAPVSCNDPIAGTWRARVWRPENAKVDEVTLTITRVGMTELRGEITVESWDASDHDADPATCPDGSPAVSRVVQLASGWLHGTEIDIVGSDPERTAFPCGIESASTYNPDHFTGELAEGPTLITSNDDGGIDQGRPHIFTRKACPRSP